MGALLGWDAAEQQRQRAAVRARIDDELAFRGATEGGSTA
jgi:hypothetical protein